MPMGLKVLKVVLIKSHSIINPLQYLSVYDAMPALADICDMLYGQALQRPWLPKKDLSGKTIIVTGSNVGIGFEVVKHLYVDTRTVQNE
jgi:hypothetical protein